MKIRNLEADDRVIIKEGIDNLTIEELQQACRDRGMRAIGLSETRLKTQLEQWLDLHINRKIPLSLLLLSRALYLPENLPPEDLIKTAISALPQSIENATKVKIAEVSGAEVDNKVKLELLKQEDAEIKLENATLKPKAVAESPVPSLKPETVVSAAGAEKVLGTAEALKKETLVDKAPVIGAEELLSPVEIKEINQIIENIPINESKQVKAEIEELKKDVDEYKEDVREVEQLSLSSDKTKLKETKSAKVLGKRVQKLLADMDSLMLKIEKETKPEEAASTANTVSIDELMATIKKIRGVSNDVKEKKFIEVLNSLDKDKDGKIDDINDVLKVFDLIEQENVKVSKDQLGKILHLLEKEKLIEMDEQAKTGPTDEKKQ